jgi:CYTH domain-containing protein
MSFEIERKFLVDPSDTSFRVTASRSASIRQGVLPHGDSKTITRVRVADDQGYLTIKGPQKGLTRMEFEYEIPVGDAIILIETLCDNVVEKTRYYVESTDVKDRIWEVDVFEGDNEGLIIAEIELEDEGDNYFEIPFYYHKEVSTDFRYQNVNLAKDPWKNWNREDVSLFFKP